MSGILENMMVDLKKESFREGWEACQEATFRFLDKNDMIRRYGKELEEYLDADKPYY